MCGIRAEEFRQIERSNDSQTVAKTPLAERLVDQDADAVRGGRPVGRPRTAGICAPEGPSDSPQCCRQRVAVTSTFETRPSVS